MERRPYPSDLDEDTDHFMMPYLVLKPEHAAQRKSPLKDGLNAFFWMSRTGAHGEVLPHDFPPPRMVQEQAQRWFDAGVVEWVVHALHLLSRFQKQRSGDPSATIIDSPTLQSTPERGHRAGYDGAKKRKGTKVYFAVDTLGHLLAILTSPANEQDRAQVNDLCLDVQEATGVKTAQQAAAAGVELIVVKRPDATKGFIRLPKRWVVECSFAW